MPPVSTARRSTQCLILDRFDGFSVDPVWKSSLEESAKDSLVVISRQFGESDLAAILLNSAVLADDDNDPDPL